MPNKKKAILIIAHGSQLNKANEEIRQLANYLNQEIKDVVIAYSFLESSKPNIEEAATTLVKQGIQKIYLYPHFLTEGRHVSKDISQITDSLKKHHPQVHFQKTEYLGKSPSFFEYIRSNMQRLLSHLPLL